ncbi:MAG: hypothetical protein HQK59_10695 [Deltaproteobacteria bacterium]|nr:hypothetical protein [Deltaproteobacteria bacterium]
MDLFSRQGQKQIIETQFGPSQVIITEHVVYIPRHGLDVQKYIFPHEVNHRANMTALKSLGITEVVAVNSVGSLNTDLPPGTIVMPDDYILLYPVPTTIADTACHLPPPAEFRRPVEDLGCGREKTDPGGPRRCLLADFRPSF